MVKDMSFNTTNQKQLLHSICIGYYPLVLSDFIGVVKSAGNSGFVTISIHKPPLLRREIEMVDRANHVAMVKLWGVHAEKNDVSANQILVIRRAKVSEYEGTYLELFWYRE